MKIRVYELSQANDGLGGVSEEKVLVYEGRGKCVQKDHEVENSPYNYDDRVYDVILPNQLELNLESNYEMEVEEWK